MAQHDPHTPEYFYSTMKDELVKDSCFAAVFYVIVHVVFFVGVIILRFVFSSCCRSKFPKSSSEITNRLVSTIHASIVLIRVLALLEALAEEEWHGMRPDNLLHFASHRHIGREVSPGQKFTLYHSVGYFLYDIIYSMCAREWDMVFHHGATVSGLIAGLYYDVSGVELVLALGLTECSTPFLNVRAIAKLKPKAEKLYKLESQYSQEMSISSVPRFRLAVMGFRRLLSKISAFIFAVTFIFARVIIAPFLVVLTLMNQRPPLIIKIGAIAVQLISFYWAVKIIHQCTLSTRWIKRQTTTQMMSEDAQKLSGKKE